jgi:hypothetical protein
MRYKCINAIKVTKNFRPVIKSIDYRTVSCKDAIKIAWEKEVKLWHNLIRVA